MQGISENILTCSDKLHGFLQKLLLWQNALGYDLWKCFEEVIKIKKTFERVSC